MLTESGVNTELVGVAMLSSCLSFMRIFFKRFLFAWAWLAIWLVFKVLAEFSSLCRLMLPRSSSLTYKMV